MSVISVSKGLVVGVEPVFIGWLDQWLYDDSTITMELVPLTADDVDEVLFSLFKKTQNIPSLNTMNTNLQPVKDWQNVSIGTNCIKPEFSLNNEFFEKMQIAPMKTNFIFIPENEPPLFASPGVYVARFEIVVKTGKKYPFAIIMTLE